MAVDVKTGEERMLLKNARIGEMAFNPVDRSLIGVRHDDGLATLVRIPYPYTECAKVYTFPYEIVPTDLDISPDGRLLSASMSEVNGDQFLRVWELDKILTGNLTPLSNSASDSPFRKASCFRGMAATCTEAAITRACPTSSAMKLPRARSRQSRMRRSGFFRPVPLADGRLVVLNYTG